MQYSSRLAVWVLAGLSLGAVTHPAIGAEAAAKAPAAVILFLDRGTVLRSSAAGKSIYAQVEALSKKMESDFAPENQKLQADIQSLQSQDETLTPDGRQAMVNALEQRRQAIQKKVQDRQAAIQAGLAAARSQLEKALGPILEKIMVERGANLLLDRGLVVLGAGEMDVTDEVITHLDAALPNVTVTLQVATK